MIANRSALRFQIGRAFRIIVPGSQPFHSGNLLESNGTLSASKNSGHFPESSFRGTSAGFTGNQPSLGNLGAQLGLTKLKHNGSSLLPTATTFKGFIHSSSQKEFENGPGQMTRSMDFVRGIIEEDRKSFPRNNNWVPQYQVETNADILHIRMMRNNSKVTLTDSDGKVKFNISAGMLPGATRVSRYSAESAAELAGRKLREMGIKSVIVKVNGFTFFKKKRQAILAVREGYTNNRGDKNPIVFIEDTTRKAHNGCRLPKQRRT